MKITSKGQITIPQKIREEYGFLPDTQVAFEVRDSGEVVLVKEKAGKTRGQLAVEHMRGTLKKHSSMSTDEIMKLMRGDD